MTTVVAGVIERHGLVLIAQRKRSGHHALKWEFPGGKVEPGESPQDALIRELQEELGIEARSPAEIDRYEFQYPDRTPIQLIFYRVAEFSGEPQNLDFEQILWVARRRLHLYDFLEGDAKFLDCYAG